MKIEAVTVSIGFGDYLAETLPRNRSKFDRFVVVTSPDDLLSQQVAQQNSCRTVLTTRHLDEGGFNKGKAINDGLDACSLSDWVCHLDADIVLPDYFSVLAPHEIKNKRLGMRASCTVFGIHRYMCDCVEDWRHYLRTGDTGRFRIEARRKDQIHLPVGFFQLWKGSKKARYPENHTTAGSSDLEFSRQFALRRHLPMECFHLSAAGWKKAEDYRGRKSAPWPAVVESS